MPTGSILDFDEKNPVEDISGIGVSGGGYRAAVFHAGAFYRFNELGLLRGIARISSVSGGSITAGALAVAWPGLQWGAGNRASNLDQKFLKPLLRQVRSTIDVGAGLSRFNPFTSPAKVAAESYDENFCGGLRLDQLPKPPDAPLFIINATSLMTGRNVRFRHDMVADYTVGVVEGLRVKLSAAVAASAAFPPFLSPALLSLAGGRIKPDSEGRKAVGKMLEEWFLTDGGVYDNMGTETIWKRCRTLFISNAGRPFEVQEDPATDLVYQPIRVIDLVMAQAEALRNRILAHAYLTGARKGAMWSLTTGQDDPDDRPPMLSEVEYHAAQQVPTRLSAMNDDTINLLLKAGYAHACSRLRRHFGPGQGGVPDIPDGKPPRAIPT